MALERSTSADTSALVARDCNAVRARADRCMGATRRSSSASTATSAQLLRAKASKFALLFTAHCTP